jgi:hypothetical protein
MRAEMDSRGCITITPETGAEAFALRHVSEVAFDPGHEGSGVTMPRPATIRSQYIKFVLEVPNGNN